MSMQDTLANALTIINNGQRAKKKTVSFPYAKMIEKVLLVLHQEGYIKAFRRVAENENPSSAKLEVKLKYHEQNEPVIALLKRVSKSGLRNYVTKDKLPKVLGGLGTSIISTSKGIVSGKQAKAMGLGGEVLAIVA